MILNGTHIARWSRILILACMLFAASAARAQDERVTLPGREITLSELFRQIKRQTGRMVVFSPDNAAFGKRVSLPAAQGTVAGMLDAVLPAEGLGWNMVEEYIVVGPARPVVPAVKYEPCSATAAQSAQVADTLRINGWQDHAAVPAREPDSVYYRTVERGPFEFAAPDRVFPAPGEFVSAAPSQRRLPGFAVKTNVLHGAVGLAPNLYGEVGLGRRTTIEAGFARNGWNRRGTAGNNRKLIHGGVTGEFRWWTCERFNGHFFGAHAFWRFYNIGGYDVPFVNFKRDYRYEGTSVGGGITYGYALPLAPRWNLEGFIGVGAARMSYDVYGCDKCADRVDRVEKTWFGPTRAGIALTFIIR